MAKIDPKRTQPEALSRFAEAARDADGNSDKPGLLSDKNTTPVATDPKLEQDAAEKVVREGVTHKDQGSKEAIDRLPDRIVKK